MGQIIRIEALEATVLLLEARIAQLEAWREQMCWRLLAESIGGEER